MRDRPDPRDVTTCDMVDERILDLSCRYGSMFDGSWLRLKSDLRGCSF